MISYWPSTSTHDHTADSIHSNPTLQESQKYDRCHRKFGPLEKIVYFIAISSEIVKLLLKPRS
jgi:hypothetical protein